MPRKWRDCAFGNSFGRWPFKREYPISISILLAKIMLFVLYFNIALNMSYLLIINFELLLLHGCCYIVKSKKKVIEIAVVA